MYKFNIAREMFFEGNSDLLFLSRLRFFSLSRAHDMLITSFLISSPSLKFTTDLWYSKYFNIFPNSSKLK